MLRSGTLLQMTKDSSRVNLNRILTSTFDIGWRLCDRVCQVLVCRGKYGLGGGGSSLHSGIEFGRSRTGEGSSGGRKKGVV
jgi:hypothetical protein